MFYNYSIINKQTKRNTKKKNTKKKTFFQKCFKFHGQKKGNKKTEKQTVKRSIGLVSLLQKTRTPPVSFWHFSPRELKVSAQRSCEQKSPRFHTDVTFWGGGRRSCQPLSEKRRDNQKHHQTV